MTLNGITEFLKIQNQVNVLNLLRTNFCIRKKLCEHCEKKAKLSEGQCEITHKFDQKTIIFSSLGY